MAGVKIEFNKAKIKAKLEKAAEATVAPLMEQVLKDSNYYCREDQHGLIASSKNASHPADGVSYGTRLTRKRFTTRACRAPT